MELRDRLIEGYKSDTIVKNVALADLLYELDGSIDSRGDADEWLINIMWIKIGAAATPLLIWNMLRSGLQTPLNVMIKRGELLMGNGHHRLIAALLCGITHADIVVTDSCDHSVTEGSFPHFVTDGYGRSEPKLNKFTESINEEFWPALKCVRADIESINGHAASWNC